MIQPARCLILCPHIADSTSVTFAEVSERARTYGVTALGVRRAGGGVDLAPTPGMPINLKAGDAIAVLADDFSLKRTSE